MTPDNILVFGRDQAIAEWVARRLGIEPWGPNVRAIGIAGPHKPLGGVVYSDWNERARTIHMTIATTSPLWAKPSTIRSLLSYPFDQLGCYKVCAATETTNKRAVKLLEHIKMKSEGILRHQFGPRRHARMFGMIEPEYRARWALKEAA